MKYLKEPWNWMIYLDKLTKLRKMGMRFGTWNMRSPHVVRELSKYTSRLGILGVQKVGWDRSGTEPAGKYTVYYRKGNETRELRYMFFVHKRII
jgi:hypothetical protein